MLCIMGVALSLINMAIGIAGAPAAGVLLVALLAVSYGIDRRAAGNNAPRSVPRKIGNGFLLLLILLLSLRQAELLTVYIVHQP